MKANDKLKNIDIVYPDTMKEASPAALLICEGFISKLLQVTNDVLNITVNTNLKLVESNQKAIKSYLDLVLKTQNLNSFYVQFTALLHKNGDDSINGAKLRCYQAGKPIVFVVREAKKSPDFSWEITRIVN